MNKPKALETFFSKHLGSVMHKIILPLDDNCYRVYKEYILTKAGASKVTIRKSGDDVQTFIDAKTAISWCAYDKKNNFVDARMVLRLDKDRRRIRDDVFFSNQQLRVCPSEDRKYTLELKTQHKQRLLDGVENQINKFVDKAKYV